MIFTNVISLNNHTTILAVVISYIIKRSLLFFAFDLIILTHMILIFLYFTEPKTTATILTF